jgi:predicted RNA-binding Zn-ribbon protein involved in translation (DUF1610 family)
MAIKKHSRISEDAIVFKFTYSCPNCDKVEISNEEEKNKKCKNCGKEMILSGTSME